MKMTNFTRVLATAFCLLGLAASPVHAITIGQVDDFQDATTQGWATGGGPNPPVNVITGGPQGAGDAFLQLTSSGVSGPGGKLVGFNQLQWTGDYSSAGVNLLTIDLNNLGVTDLVVRLAINGAGGQFSTTAGALLAIGSGWGSYAFAVDANAWTSVGGSDINATLGAVSMLRIVSATNPSFQGDKIDAMLGVDNISAVPVPAAAWLFGSGLIGLLGAARRKH